MIYNILILQFHNGKKNKLNATSIKFQKALTGFNEASASFKCSLQSKIVRQARLVNRDITEEQIEEIINLAQSKSCSQQTSMIPDAMIDCIAAIEEKHEKKF